MTVYQLTQEPLTNVTISCIDYDPWYFKAKSNGIIVVYELQGASKT